jgi:ABC-type nickel/cobalt efflux system permease component RcnA
VQQEDRRREIVTVLIGVGIGVAIAVVVLVWAKPFANSSYSNGASNFLGIVGFVPLLAALAIAAWSRWHRTCAVPYCLRTGEHPVKGTLQKVCSHHHTTHHHELVFEQHHRKHVESGRLDFGQSHERGAS